MILPNSVTGIYEKAFYNCYGMSSIIIGNSVKIIGKSAFSSLSDSFTQVTIPGTVTSIGYEAFYDCTGLTSISYTGTIAQWNAITKGLSWNNKVPAKVVHCSDGDVAI